MPKTKQQKADDVKQLTDALQSMKSVVISGYKGLTVNEINELRRMLRIEGVTMKVVKRTLFLKAAKAAGIADLPDGTFEGGIQLAFATNDEVAPARLLFAFAKKHEALDLRAGFLGTDLLTKEQVVSLAQLPGKDQLRGQLVSVIAGPLRGLVTVLAGPLRGLVTVLQKRSEQSA
ncbi:MAG: 50S ribosomal protein L10 [Candidatus Kerfeldbacteria bacterium]|nr:50S ribosomal protein L10 [Candidatus Kerfeldbacteria bacterium]